MPKLSGLPTIGKLKNSALQIRYKVVQGEVLIIMCFEMVKVNNLV